MKRLFVIAALLFSLNCQGKALLFVGTEFPSILENGATGEVQGLGVDVVNTIGQRLGLEIEITILPFKRALRMMEQGAAEVMIGPYKSLEREQYMQYSHHAFYQDPLFFYTKVDKAFAWQGDYSLLKRQLIALVLGWHYGADFEKSRALLDISEVADLEAGLKLLKAQRVDLLVAHPRAINSLIRQQGVEKDVVALQPAIQVNRGYFAFSNKAENINLIRLFNEQLDSLVNSGELAKLAQKYPDVQLPH